MRPGCSAIRCGSFAERENCGRGLCYGEFGVSVLGVGGYPAGVVSPHASALALAVMPAEAIGNLRSLADRYDIYGVFGF